MRSKKFLSVLAMLVFGSLAFAMTAVADHGHHGDRGRHEGHGAKVVRSSLAPSVPTDPAFHGVTPGGAPWRLDRGAVRIDRSGEFELEVRGLVLTTTGTAGPVTAINA